MLGRESILTGFIFADARLKAEAFNRRLQEQAAGDQQSGGMGAHGDLDDVDVVGAQVVEARGQVAEAAVASVMDEREASGKEKITCAPHMLQIYATDVALLRETLAKHGLAKSDKRAIHWNESANSWFGVRTQTRGKPLTWSASIKKHGGHEVAILVVVGKLQELASM